MTTRSKDTISWRDLLGMGFVVRRYEGQVVNPGVDQLACSIALSRWLNAFIAYKFSKKNAGGWIVGRIVRCYVDDEAVRECGCATANIPPVSENAPINLRVHWADDTFSDIAAHTAGFVKDGEEALSAFHWTFVVEQQPKMKWPPARVPHYPWLAGKSRPF